MLNIGLTNLYQGTKMKKTVIALVLLALMSLPIAKTFADLSVPPLGPPLFGKPIDPSTIPEPKETPQGAGIIFTGNISPAQSYQQITYTLQNTHDQSYVIANFSIPITGSYDIIFDFFYTNPSYKWACAVQYPIAGVTPYTSVTGNIVHNNVSPPLNDIFADGWSNLTWSASNGFVWRNEVTFTVVSVPCNLLIFGKSNQMWTDQNSDGKIDITDIAIVARHFGTVYQEGDTHLLTDSWNVVHDNFVDLSDIVAVVREFGRTIPP